MGGIVVFSSRRARVKSRFSCRADVLSEGAIENFRKNYTKNHLKFAAPTDTTVSPPRKNYTRGHLKSRWIERGRCPAMSHAPTGALHVATATPSPCQCKIFPFSCCRILNIQCLSGSCASSFGSFDRIKRHCGMIIILIHSTLRFHSSFTILSSYPRCIQKVA